MVAALALRPQDENSKRWKICPPLQDQVNTRWALQISAQKRHVADFFQTPDFYIQLNNCIAKTKLLAVFSIILGFIAMLSNAQPTFTDTSNSIGFIAGSSKSTETTVTVTRNHPVFAVTHLTLQTVVTPVKKSNSANEGTLAIHHQPTDTFLPSHFDAKAVFNTAREYRSEKLDNGVLLEAVQGDETSHEEADQGDEDSLQADQGNERGPGNNTDGHENGPHSAARPVLDGRSPSVPKTGGFAKTCASNWVVWDLCNTIWANCCGSGDRRDALSWSGLSLDHMLGNDRGELVYRPGAGCARWGRTHLACRCLDERGEYHASAINLDKYIGNHDGLLCSEYECGVRENQPPGAN
ncbi:Putative cyanovirin-N [Colletotrichum destructivum]|uniref:Cyanovirin-N n=1 Tax=Colletotrichum destructivum TaxID=34406 RepID=A0AAX4IGV1_9PEZI|nr:Putative cyanovirin-N [Colletotrichum destructivum]